MSLSLPDIEQLFAQRGDEQYSGEPVTQLEHALQSAHLARESGASPALVTAALLSLGKWHDAQIRRLAKT